MRWLLPAAALLAVLSVPSPARAEGDPNAVNFEKDIAPFLAKNCAGCHDGRKKKADYRLDIRKLAFAGGESKVAAIVPGKPEESELYKRLVTDDEETQMPPGGVKVPAAQAAKVKAWILDGAKWPDALANEQAGPKHWAFTAPTRPAVPAGAKHPIDAFVLARLKREGLSPSPVAEATTLIRRLHLDLTGLPPTPAEVDAFIADSSPDAGKKLVEKLLTSPHYGERWGRLWLDAARYADSDGYEKDKPRFVHYYRDYVIDAFNRDLPYDRFVIEQLAGDLLPNPTQDQRTATGFLRNSMVNEEGGIDPEQFRMEAMFDRMDAVGKSVLGLTVACAQCHTHKYDPITHADYYRLFAFLNSAHEATATVYTPANQMRRAEILRKVEAIEADLKHKSPDWAAKMAAWEKALPTQPAWDRAARPRHQRRREAHRSARRLRPRRGLRADQVGRHLPGEAAGRRADHRGAARTAHRPDAAPRRAGPLGHGDVRADRVRSPRQRRRGQDRVGHQRRRRPGAAARQTVRRQVEEVAHRRPRCLRHRRRRHDRLEY